MSNSDSNRKGDFGERKVSACHLLYLVVIAALFILALILWFPNKVSVHAFDNFSFAATLVSIVLAVVSIVYTLNSGLVTFGHLHSMSEVERRIHGEIDKLSAIDKNVNLALKSLQDLHDETSDLKAEVSDMKTASIHDAENPGDVDEEGEKGSESNKRYPLLMCIVIYACARSYETKRIFPYDTFVNYDKEASGFAYGVIRTLCILKSDAFAIQREPSSNVRFTITRYEPKKLGIESKDNFASELKTSPQFKVLKKLIVSLDSYFDASGDDAVG